MAKTIKGNGTINGTNASEIIIGGKGNDTITGGKGNDTITGGTGTNTIIYRKGDGNDVINFTKNEDFILQMEGFESDDMDKFSTGYSSNKRDLILYLNEERTQFIIFKDFALRDVTHSAKFRINGDEADLNDAIVSTITNGNFTGSRLTDDIDASGAELKKTIKVNGRKQTVDKVASDKGLVLNGGAGDDSIIGSKYSDTIIGGDGNDTIKGGDGNDVINGGTGDDSIEGGKGNDVITGGAGRNTIVHHNGDGNDVIYFSKDEKITLKMDSFYGIELSPDKKDIRLYTTADRDEYITIKNYDKYASNDRSTDLGRIELKVGDDEHYDYYALQDFYFKEDVNNNFKGTTYNDEIDASGATKGLRLDGGAGDDFIIGTDYSDTIIGEIGDDYIQGGKGNDIITGGTGDNVISYCLGDGDDVIYLTKGEKLTINFSKFGTNPDGTPIYDWEEMPNMGYSASQNGRDLIIYVDKNDLTKGSLTLKDFLVKDVTDGVRINIKNSVPDGDFPFETIFLKPENIKVETKVNGFNFTGSRFDDKIDASGTILTKTVKVGRTNQIIERLATDKGLVLNGGAGNDSIIGSKYSDTILGGIGDDILQGGRGNDVITGGTGHNTIYFSENDGNDVINLTKGEQLEIQFVDSNFELIETPNFGYEKAKNGKDIILYFDKNDHTKGSLTIKNFLTKDITNNATKTTDDDSSVIVTIKNADDTTKTVDLKHDLFETITNKNFTGYWLNDKIDASGAVLTKTVKVGRKNQTVEKVATDKGLVLNGGAGDDEITGSKYSDTIIGGVGDDKLYGGDGNDVITGGTGKNTIFYAVGDGNDIINLTKGEQLTLQMDSYYSIEVAKNGKDVLIYTTSAKDEYITIKNLAVKDVTNDKSKTKADESYVKLVSGSGTVDLRSYVYEKTTNKNFTGTWLNDKIDASEAVLTKTVKVGRKKQTVEKVATDKGLVLNGGAGNDSITGTKYSDTIIGGVGNDTIEGGKGNDVITGGTGENTIVYHTGDGNDVINLTKGEKFTLKMDSYYRIEIAKNKKDVLIYTTSAKNEYITIKNLAVKDITNDATKTKEDESYVKIVSGSGNIEDLRRYLFEKKITDNTNFTGTWLRDKIDATGATLYKDKKNTVEKDVTDKGLVLNGGAGDDEIYGSKYSDTIYGGIGNDYISGGKGNDKIYGGAGDDNITGGEGNDLLYGDAGDDRIFGDVGNDTIYGGAGKDTIGGGDGDDYLDGGADDDIIDGGSGNDTIYGGAGKDTIGGEEGNDYLDGGADDDYIEGGAGNDTILGGAGNDTIRGGNGDDLIYGGAGNDEIYGDAGDDTIYAGDGDDTIYAFFDKNLIFAGKGNDKINASLGAENTYVFNNGDGICTIDMNYYSVPDNEVKHDTINLTGVTKTGFKIEVRNGDIGRDGQYRQDVYIRYNLVRGTYKDCIIIKNFIDYSVDLKDIEILTKDGQRTSLNEILKNNVSDGNLTKGRNSESNNDNDTLLGSFLGDTITANGANSRVYGGDANDSITSTGGNSTIYGGAGNDFITGGSGDIIYGDDGDDLIYGGADGNEIYGGAGGDNIYGGSGNDTIDGGDDDDGIEGGDGNDSINGGNGNDYIKGGNGNDTIYGDSGNDTIFGDAGDDIIYGGVGDDAIVGGLGNDLLYGENGNDFIDGGEGNDTIYAGDGDDTIDATLGENLVYAGTGDDVIKSSLYAKNTYVCKNDDGKTTINFDGNNLNHVGTLQDVISLEDVDQSDYTVEVQGNDVYIYYNNRADYIVISDYMRNLVDKKDLIIRTKDGVEKSLKDDASVANLINNGRKFESTSDNDTIYGSELRDTITAYGADATIYGKGGDDLINGGDGNDTIDGGDGNDIIYGGKGKDVLHGGNGDDQIYGGAGDDLIYGDAGDDSIIAGSGNDTIYGGDGNDDITAGSSGTKLIVGGKGDDIIKLNTSATNILEFNNGDGNDTVEETVDGTGNVATIKLNDTAKDGFSQKVSGNDLIISYNKDESGIFQDTITYKDFFRTSGDVAEVKITTNDGYESTVDVNALKSNVASWLNENGFGDIATGMASATDDQRAALNQIFESCQQQILPS